jgi:uncharacterized protein YjbI with pentapeptide repeats
VDLAGRHVRVAGDDRHREAPLVRAALLLGRIWPRGDDAGHRDRGVRLVDEKHVKLEAGDNARAPCGKYCLRGQCRDCRYVHSVTTRRAPAAGEVSRSSGWLTVALVVYLVLAATAIVVAPPYLVDASLPSDDAEENALTAAQLTAARQVVLLAAGGVLAVFTLALTQRRDAVARARHEIDRDANRTTRYTEAVKQLGDDKTAVRFGGIYALGRIGEDSDRDGRTIVQVLQAYITEAAPHLPDRRYTRWERVLRFLSPGFVHDQNMRKRDAQALKASTAKAAVEVVGRLSSGLVGDGIRIDLRRTDLRGAKLEAARLSGAMFTQSDLSFVDFCDAILDDASFSRATLSHARLQRIHAHRAFFMRTTAHKADFTNADLQDSIFGEGNFASCIFDGADLSRVRLTGAYLKDTSFNGANLQGADLRGMTATGISFKGADLRGIQYDGDLAALGDVRGAKLGPLPRNAYARAGRLAFLKR